MGSFEAKRAGFDEFYRVLSRNEQELASFDFGKNRQGLWIVRALAVNGDLSDMVGLLS
ncbi:hypothetical protein JD969_02585 [Planctomycetota bacterium]|nr:hypothetical protein JD969_02585 [Planctomycetota bacterium]